RDDNRRSTSPGPLSIKTIRKPETEQPGDDECQTPHRKTGNVQVLTRVVGKDPSDRNERRCGHRVWSPRELAGSRTGIRLLYISYVLTHFTPSRRGTFGVISSP